MSEDIVRTKLDFEKLKGLRSNVIEILGALRTKLSMVRGVYRELLQTHGQGVYLFGIDSLYFQHSLIQRECDALETMRAAIDNRVYCEYYRLHQQIQAFVTKELPHGELRKLVSTRNYPPYRSLEPLKQYDFGLVVDLQRVAVNAVVELRAYCASRNQELESDSSQAQMGLNIDNLVNSYHFANALLQEKNKMFLRYLEAFHLHHTKYYTRLLLKAKLVLGTMNEDIRIQQSSRTTAPVVPVLSAHEENVVRGRVDYGGADSEQRAALDSMVGSARQRSPSPVTVAQEDVGRRCRVEGYDCEGTLRFVGPHATKQGVRCGVELDEPVGNNNGTVGDHKYFVAAEGSGLLCVPRKLHFVDQKLMVDDGADAMQDGAPTSDKD